MPIADSSTVAAVSALRTLSEQTDFLAVMFTYSCGVAFQFPDDFKAQKFPGLVFCGVIRNSEREVPPRPRGPFRSIGKELTEARIFEWFTWKNGTPLSGAKPKSVIDQLRKAPLRTRSGRTEHDGCRASLSIQRG